MSQLPRKVKPTRTERALKKACPKCGAAKGEQCTRSQPSFVARERQHYTPAALANLAKMGEPLVRPHNERFHALPDNPQARWEKQQAREARARELAELRWASRDAILKERWGPDARLQRKARSLVVQQVLEKRFTRWEMLVRFFAQHGDIFKEPTR